MTSDRMSLVRQLVASVLTGVLGAGVLAAVLLSTTAPALAHSSAGSGSDARRLVEHRVRPGETVTGLAVRFRAWTDEVIARNHLGRDARLDVGQRLVIPVVVSAIPRQHHTHHTHHAHHARSAVRRVVARTAAAHGVDPQLALAVAWQESGWRMGPRSDAGAIGAMQVLPSTGAWMSLYEGRRLRLHRLHDNVTAGVRLLDVLLDETTRTRRAVAAYYQGLGAVREHGIYGESRPYVRTVLAIRDRLEAGRPPA